MASIGTVEGYLKLTDDFTTVLDRAMGALQKSTGMMNTNLAQMNAALSATGQAAKTMGAAAKKAGDDVAVGAAKAKSGASMMHDLRAAYALSAIAIWQFIDRTVAAQQASDRMRNSLLAGTGDIKIVGQELAFIREESNRLGLDLAAAGVQYGKLTAASKGTGIAMKDVRATFTAVAEAATALGLSSEDTTGALNAVVQMMTKGTVQAEELRGQLGDRIPGAVQAMSRALGVSNEEMMKMLEQGQVITADVLPRFAEELAKIGGAGVVAGAQSFNAELNRLKTSLFDLFSGIAGDVSLPNFIAGMREFVGIVDDLMRNGGGAAIFEQLSTAIAGALGGVGKLLEVYTKLVELANKGMEGSGLEVSDFTVGGAIVGVMNMMETSFKNSKTEIAGWVADFKEGMSTAGGSMFQVVGAFQQGQTEADKFFAEVSASGRALSSEDLLAFANKENARNLKEMRDRLKDMTKESLAFQKANAAAFDLEDKIKNQSQELAVYQKLVKENGGDFELAKKNAASYYAVLKAGLDPLKGWGKVLYDTARANDALEASMERAKKEASDFDKNVTKLAKAFNKDWADGAKDAGDAVTKFGKDIAGAMGQMEKFRADVDNYWGAWAAAQQGEDALRAFNKEAEIQAEIQARLGVRLTSNATLYDMYAAEIRDSMGAMIDHRNEIEATLEKYEGMAAVLNNTDWGSDKMNDVASGLARMVSAMGKLTTATKLFSKESAQSWADVLNGITAVLEASGAFQTGNGGGFGGTSEGNYQAEGAMVGMIIGGIIGAMAGGNVQAGMAIGSAAGGMLGSFIKKGAEEALGQVQINTDQFMVTVRKAEGDLGSSMNSLGNSIAISLMDIVASIGGQLGAMPTVDMKIRDGVIGVVIGGVEAKFKEMDDAISFAVTELLKQGDILGIDAMLRNALQNTTSSSLEGLSRDMEAVMEVLSFGMTSSQQTIMTFTNELDGLRGQMVRLLTDTEQLGKAMGNLALEETRRWQSSRDAITGDKKSNAEKLALLKADGTMWNAEKALRIAELEVRKASIIAQAEMAAVEVRIFHGQTDAEIDRLQTRVDIGDAEMQMFGLQAKGMMSMIGATATASMTLFDVQLNAIDQLLAALRAMPDIDVPRLQLPNVGGSGGGNVNTGPSEAEQRAIDFEAFMRDRFLASLPELARRLEEINQRYAEQAVAAAEVAGGTELLAAAREEEMIQLRRELIDGLGLPLESVRDRFAALRETLAFLQSEVDRTGLGANRLAQVLYEFGQMMQAELLDLATYFTDAMGDTTASAAFRAQLAELEWDMRRAEMALMVQQLTLLGVFNDEQRSFWENFLANLSDDLPQIIAPPPPDEDEGGGSNNNSGDTIRQSREQALLTALERLRNALDKYRDLFADMQTNAKSGRTLEQRSQNAYQQFQDMLLLAQGGDLNAIEGLPDAFNTALDLLGQFLDPSSSQFQLIRDQMLAAMEGIAGGIQGVLDDTQTPAEQAVTELRTIAEILNEIRALGWGNPNWDPGNGSARILHGPQSHTRQLNGASNVMLVSAPSTDAAIAQMESRLATKIERGFATLSRATVRDTDKAEQRNMRAAAGGRYGQFVEPDGVAS